MYIPVLLGLDPLDARGGDDGARLDALLDDAEDARHVVQVVARRRDRLHEAVEVVRADPGQETSDKRCRL